MPHPRRVDGAHATIAPTLRTATFMNGSTEIDVHSVSDDAHPAMTSTASHTTYGPCKIWMEYRSLGRMVPRGSGRCLELGARRGVFRKLVETRGFQYVGIDIDFYKEVSAVGDAHAVPFKDQSFDLVLLPCVLEHFRDPRIALDEVNRITVPGGKIVGSVAFLEPFHHSYFHFSHAALEDALRVAGFTDLMLDTGANAFLLLYARLFSMFLRLHNRKAVSLLTRILCPLNLVLDVSYYALLLKNMVLRRDLAAFRARYEAFRKDTALRFAGHIMFTAVKRA
jgi:SAM-dependent methyltransferase